MGGRKWAVATMGCRAAKKSPKWNVAQMGCHAIEMSRRWDIAQTKRRENDVNPTG